MKFTPLQIPDVVLVEPSLFGDARGWFQISWNRKEFAAGIGHDVDFVQDNHSRSGGQVLRGMHYQLRQPQGKLVRVVQGRVFDVAVDMRRSSPHFGKWVGCELSAENKHMLWVPPGFAHGFVTLSDSAEFVYKVTDYYAPAEERCLLWNDPDVGVRWPIDFAPTLAAKDLTGQSLHQIEAFP